MNKADNNIPRIPMIRFAAAVAVVMFLLNSGARLSDAAALSKDDCLLNLISYLKYYGEFG